VKSLSPLRDYRVFLVDCYIRNRTLAIPTTYHEVPLLGIITTYVETLVTLYMHNVLGNLTFPTKNLEEDTLATASNGKLLVILTLTVPYPVGEMYCFTVGAKASEVFEKCCLVAVPECTHNL
jgi:hypothetical protein